MIDTPQVWYLLTLDDMCELSERLTEYPLGATDQLRDQMIEWANNRNIRSITETDITGWPT